MAMPTTEVIHHGSLEIRRDGVRFGELWIKKGNIYWMGSKRKRNHTRSWKEFEQFMTRKGKFKNV
jgi:hypothetical protein